MSGLHRFASAWRQHLRPAPPQRRRRAAVLVALAVGVPAAARNVSAAGDDLTMAVSSAMVPGTLDLRSALEGVSPELLLSKALSLAVIAGSCIGKFPQIHAVWRARSAEGISKISIWTETVSMGVQFAYNAVRGTPLTTYAEIAILFPQLLLLALVAAWADGYLGARVVLACLIICSGTAVMALGIVPPAVTTAAYAANALLGIVAVVPQVVINYRNKSTGQLSFVVTAMTFGGICTRLFTTFVEVDDLPLQMTMMVNWCLVAMLMCQFFLYRDTRPLPAKPIEAASPSESDKEPILKKTESVAQVLAAIGSSRCLSEMVDKDVVDGTMQVIKLRSSQSLSHIAGSMSFTALPYISNSVPELSEFDGRQATGMRTPSPTLGLRRN